MLYAGQEAGTGALKPETARPAVWPALSLHST